MPAPNAKPPTLKKAPGGVPIWGWVAAGIAGLVIAYMITRKSGAASQDAGTESGANPLGLSDSGVGGGVVAPPPPANSPPPGGSSGGQSGLGSEGGGDSGGDSGGSSGGGTTTTNDLISTLTDPAQTVFGQTVDLAAADSTLANAQFQTSPYIAPSGNVVVGPGGPVIDYGDVAPPVSTTPVITNSSDWLNPPNPNILSSGAVMDADTSVFEGVSAPLGFPPSEPSISSPQTTVLPHGQVVD